MSFVMCKIGNVYSLIKDTYHIVNIDKDGKLNISGCCNADDIQTDNRGRILINDLEDIVKSQKPELLNHYNDNIYKSLREENHILKDEIKELNKLKQVNEYVNFESRNIYLENQKLREKNHILKEVNEYVNSESRNIYLENQKLREKNHILKDEIKELNKLKQVNEYVNFESRNIYLENQKLREKNKYLQNTLSNIEKIIEVNK